METKNYAKSSEKWDFSTINATIFSLKKRLNCSLNTLESLTTGWYSTFWVFADASCQSCQTHFGNLSSPLINYIFKIYYLLAGIFAARNEFDTLTLWHLDTFELFRILNINQLQGSPMYSKSNSTSFLVKKWSRWWSKKPTFRSFSHSFWSPFIHLRSLRFADSWLKFGENRCARCNFW